MYNSNETKPSVTIINCGFFGKNASAFAVDLLRGVPATLEGCIIAPLSCFSQEDLDKINARTKD